MIKIIIILYVNPYFYHVGFIAFSSNIQSLEKLNQLNEIWAVLLWV